MTKKHNTHIIVASLLLVLSLIFVFGSAYKSQTSTAFAKFDDTVAKSVITTTSGIGFFANIGQAVKFTPSTAYVGDMVKMIDTFTVPAGKCVGIVKIFLKSPSSSYELIVEWDQMDDPFRPGENMKNEAWFYPSKVGTYEAKTEYHFQTCDQYPSSIGGDVQQSTNKLQVSKKPITIPDPVPDPVPEPCSKQSGWSNWQTDTNGVPNGVVEFRIYQDVDSSCNYYESNREVKTTCNTGFKVVGTANSPTGQGRLACEPISSPDPTPDPTPGPEPGFSVLFIVMISVSVLMLIVVAYLVWRKFKK